MRKQKLLTLTDQQNFLASLQINFHYPQQEFVFDHIGDLYVL